MAGSGIEVSSRRDAPPDVVWERRLFRHRHRRLIGRFGGAPAG